MDQGRFDTLTVALVSGAGRRQALAGLLAGTAAVFGSGLSSSGKKRNRKKKCTYCPQRACCSCAADVQQGPIRCALIETPSQSDIQTACDAFCGTDDLFNRIFAIAGSANFCAADNRCEVKECPVKV